MPTVVIAVPQSDITVTRNIVKDIADDLIRTIGFASDKDIIIQEKIGQPPTTGGTLEPTPKVKLTEENHAIISYDEVYDENDINNSVVYREEYPYLFMDPHLGIALRPTYGKVKLEMEVKLQFRDNSQLSRWRRHLRIRGGLNAFLGQHAVRYDYGIPNAIVSYLYDAHRLRESVLGYGESLGEYLNRYFFKGLIRRENRDGSYSRLALDEQQENIQGFFSAEIFYNERSEENGTYSATFTYTVSYLQVLALVLDYQLMIHNQLMPTVYRNDWDIPEQRVDDAERTLSYMGDDDLPTGLTRYFQGDGGYRYDPLDDWFPKNAYDDTRSILMSPLIIDSGDLRLLVDLHDFDSSMIDPRIIDYVSQYSDAAKVHYQGLFLVTVYRVNAEEEELTIDIDPNGVIRSVADVNLRDRHYLRVSVLTDPGKLPYYQVKWLLDNPDLALFYLSFLSDKVVLSDSNSADIPDMLNLKVVGNRRITLLSWQHVVKSIPSTNQPYRQLVENTPKYNLYGIVSVHRKSI